MRDKPTRITVDGDMYISVHVDGEDFGIINIDIKDGKVTVRVRNCDVDKVLHVFAETTKIETVCGKAK